MHINILIVSVLLCYDGYFIKLAVFLKHIYHHLLIFFFCIYVTDWNWNWKRKLEL